MTTQSDGFAVGSPLELLHREIVRLREAASVLAEQLTRLAIVHHGTRTNSKLHRPEDQGFRECPCATCRAATAVLARYVEGNGGD